jgi:hypothetical protein
VPLKSIEMSKSPKGEMFNMAFRSGGVRTGRTFVIDTSKGNGQIHDQALWDHLFPGSSKVADQ